jgi:hypothetical protein
MKRLERGLTARLLRFKDLIRVNVPVARQALRKLLIGPVVLEAAENGYTIRRNPCVGALFPSARDIGVPKEIRTPVAAVKGQCPRPLDDGDG